MTNKVTQINKTYITIAIIIGAAILGFGVLNYISGQKNRELEKTQAELKKKDQQLTVQRDNQEKCQKAGEKKFQEEEAYWKGISGLYSPVYHFNLNLNTCLLSYYSHGLSSASPPLDEKGHIIVNPNGLYYRREILDVYSNKTLDVYEHDVVGDQKKDAENLAEFNKYHDQLFNDQ